MNRAFKNIHSKEDDYKYEYHLTKTLNYNQMKRSVVFAIALLFALTFSADAKDRGYEVEINYFYHTLAPHGEWIELEYDNYVWRPNHVGRNWSPYSEGRWVWSSDGWYWDSYEIFGWATYHYGRWHYDRFYGWVWTPGNEWAPAWVEWRHDNDYIGWAPLPPYAHFNTRFGIQFSIEWNSPYSHWRFVKYSRFTHKHVRNYYVGKHSVRKIFGRTKHVTNYKYEGRRIVNRGIKRSIIERRGRTKIHETRMDNVSGIRNRIMKGDDRNSVRVYRPSEVEVARSRNNNLYTRKSVKRKEETNQSNNEKTNKVKLKNVDNERNTIQKKERSQTKNINSSNRKVTKSVNKSGVDKKTSRVKKDTNNNSINKRSEKKRVEKQVRSRS